MTESYTLEFDQTSPSALNDIEFFLLFKSGQKTLFKIPIYFPETIIEGGMLKEDLLTLAELERNIIDFRSLNECLIQAEDENINKFQFKGTLYINVPDLFTIRLQVTDIITGSEIIAYVSYIVPESADNTPGWQLEILHGENFLDPIYKKDKFISNNGSLQIIKSQDTGSTSVRTTRGNSHVNYMFDNVYEKLLTDLKGKPTNVKRGGPKMESQSPTEPSSQYSLFSPFTGANSQVERLPVEAILYNISNHTVDGLQKVADNKKDNIFYTGSPYRKISGLDGGEQKQKSLKAQLRGKPVSFKNCYRMINDTVDRAHDFIKVYDSVTTYNKEQLKECETFYPLLKKLVTGGNNINVSESHSIQEENVELLHNELSGNNIIIPALPKDVFVSRRFIYADFVEFLFKLSTNTDKDLYLKRQHYAESGKQVSISTLRAYLANFPSDTNEKELFLRDVSLLSGNNLDTIESIEVLINEILNQNEFKQRGINGDYPLIKKNCYQQMDGCTTGPKAATASTPQNSVIEGIFGLFDIGLIKTACLEQGNNQNLLRVFKGNSLLYQAPIEGEITLDKVVRSIMKVEPESEYPFRGSSKQTDTYPIGNNDIQKEGNINKFGFARGITKKSEKILILMALKTFCDKLYRLSMPSPEESGRVTLTHIYTIDSYVYGDPYLQYLLGEVEYCPAVLRSASGIVNDDMLEGDGGVKKNPICDTGGKTKGFWFRPSMGIDLSQAGILEKLYDRFVAYFYMLINALRKSGMSVDLLSTFNEDIPVPDIESQRLNNYIERIFFFYEKKRNQVFNIEYDEFPLSYNKIMGHLAYLEICKVLKDIQEYIKNAIVTYMEINRETPDLEVIRNFLIKLPDLENILQLSIPTYFVENQDILVNPGVSDRQEARERAKFLRNTDKAQCSGLFGINIGDDGNESSKVKDDGDTEYTYINYNSENDEITYSKGGKMSTKPFSLELFIGLYNLQSDTEVKGEMLEIIKEKIDTLKDLIGITDDSCEGLMVVEPTKRLSSLGETDYDSSPEVRRYDLANRMDLDNQQQNIFNTKTEGAKLREKTNPKKSAETEGTTRTIKKGTGIFGNSVPMGREGSSWLKESGQVHRVASESAIGERRTTPPQRSTTPPLSSITDQSTDSPDHKRTKKGGRFTRPVKRRLRKTRKLY